MQALLPMCPGPPLACLEQKVWSKEREPPRTHVNSASIRDPGQQSSCSPSTLCHGQQKEVGEIAHVSCTEGSSSSNPRHKESRECRSNQSGGPQHDPNSLISGNHSSSCLFCQASRRLNLVALQPPSNFIVPQFPHLSNLLWRFLWCSLLPCLRTPTSKEDKGSYNGKMMVRGGGGQDQDLLDPQQHSASNYAPLCPIQKKCRRASEGQMAQFSCNDSVCFWKTVNNQAM